MRQGLSRVLGDEHVFTCTENEYMSGIYKHKCTIAGDKRSGT